LTRVSLQTGLTGNSERAALDGLRIVLDDTTLTGGAEAANFSRPAVRFDLAADAIDLDRYMPPSTETVAVAGSDGAGDGAATPAGGAAPSAAAPVPVGLPLDTLRKLDLIGKARIERLKVSNLSVSDAQLRLEAQGGVIQLNPISVSLYQGVAKGRMALDVSANQPALSSTMNVVNVQAEPLLKDLQGEALLAGRGQVVLDLKATGLTSDSLKRSLNGNVGIKFLDGAVMGVNVAQIIREAQAALSGQPLDQARQPNRTDFAELSGTAAIVNGTINNQDLALKSPLLRIQGAGSASLPTETIDYLINASVVESLEGQGGRGLADLRGLTIPVRVSGTFSQPSYQPDVEAVLTGIAKAKAQEELERRQDELQSKGMEKLKKQLGDQLGGEVGEKLKGFFK
jgi:AsmA protein